MFDGVTFNASNSSGVASSSLIGVTRGRQCGTVVVKSWNIAHRAFPSGATHRQTDLVADKRDQFGEPHDIVFRNRHLSNINIAGDDGPRIARHQIRVAQYGGKARVDTAVEFGIGDFRRSGIHQIGEVIRQSRPAFCRAMRQQSAARSPCERPPGSSGVSAASCACSVINKNVVPTR